jgi:hypothetical protein
MVTTASGPRKAAPACACAAVSPINFITSPVIFLVAREPRGILPNGILDDFFLKFLAGLHGLLHRVQNHIERRRIAGE